MDIIFCSLLELIMMFTHPKIIITNDGTIRNEATTLKTEEVPSNGPREENSPIIRSIAGKDSNPFPKLKSSNIDAKDNQTIATILMVRMSFLNWLGFFCNLPYPTSLYIRINEASM